MALEDKRLSDIVHELAERPRHEKVRALVFNLLTDGLGAESRSVDFEKPLPEARGRTDALLGCTVFEFKSDLRREKSDAEEELGRYLPEREKATRSRFVGLATDGADWIAYEMRDGVLVELRSYKVAVEKPRELLAWIDGTVALTENLPTDPLTLIYELGRDSIAYLRSLGELRALWRKYVDHPDVMLKRQLWNQLLTHVYGKSVDEDQLWFQHTFLTIIAKSIAIRSLGLTLPGAADLLSGKPFRDAGVYGAVESDFFDWVLVDNAGAELVERLSRHVERFGLTDVETDVLKVLYESLIDPEQRHDLGEYYTPDWLAARVCERAIEKPLEQNVLDPACGSGSFLFHALRRFIAAARKSGLQPERFAEAATAKVTGMDIHPIAVIIARVTYLLGLGDYLRSRTGNISIPVYLGDALQSNVKAMIATREVVIPVPPTRDGETRSALVFPAGLCEEPAKFDMAVDTLLHQSEAKGTPQAVTAALKRNGVSDQDSGELGNTYRELRKLHESGRDHIWGYVARNLSRPLWLSSKGHKIDILIGNPPWLSFRYMDREMQRHSREEMSRLGIWVGGKLATHQDLSALFFARTVELYLKEGGTIAFVMPMAVLTRGQFEKFRKGDFDRTKVRFAEAWAFDEHVQPLFPVPSAVLIATRAARARGVPEKVRVFRGEMPCRDAPPEVARKHLTEAVVGKLSEASFDNTSPYRNAFRQGATLVPRMLCLVERVETGRLGGTASAPLVHSRRSRQEKRPWKDLPPLEGRVEAEFLRPVYLGESIAPYRVLGPVTGVIPFDDAMLTSTLASTKGWPLLAEWMNKAEGLWKEHGAGRLSFVEQLDYFGKLSAQFPIPKFRVCYAASGSLPAAVLINDERGVVELGLYWTPVDTELEGYYLLSIFNSETVRTQVERLQARGQWGARHFDKVMFTLPIPRFDANNALHSDLASAATEAGRVAASVAIDPGTYFITARRQIRAALEGDGIAAQIEHLVDRLLETPLSVS